MRNIKRFTLILGLSVAVGSTAVSCAGKKETVKAAEVAKEQAKQRAVDEEAAKRKAEEEARQKAEAEKTSAEAAKRKAEEEARQKAAAAQRQADLTLEAIHFDFDKSNLRPDAQAILAGHGTIFQKYPEVTATIEGHCDERGTVEYNLALGERRAKSAYDYLVRYGIAGKRLKSVSFGEEKPIDPGHNEDAWAKNRRDDFVVVDSMAGK